MLFKSKHKDNEAQQQNITQINNDYTYEKTLKKQQTSVQRKQARRRMNVILLIGAIFILPLTYRLINNVSQVREMDEQIVQVTDEKTTLEKENQLLHVQVGLLQDDEYVAKLARSRYYFSKDKEIIFSLPEDNQSKAANKVE